MHDRLAAVCLFWQFGFLFIAGRWRVLQIFHNRAFAIRGVKRYNIKIYGILRESSFYMVKKVLIYIVVFVLCVTALMGCGAVTDGAANTGYAFVQKIADRDYNGAYEYIYSFSADVQSEADFVERFTNIYDALEITDVTLLSRNVEQQDESTYVLNYSLQMESDLLGTVTYDFSTDIISGPLGYNVIYMPSLILPMLEEGDKVRIANQTGIRGEIFTADGDLLAKNDYAQSIYIDLDKNPDFAAIKEFLIANFDGDAEKLQKKYDNAVEKEFPTEVLMTFPKGTLTDAQKAQIAEVEGLGLDESRLTPIRYYPLRDAASHLTGYLNSPTDEQLEQYKDLGVTESSLVGQTGIEKEYEQTLMGENGRIIYIEDGKGDQKEILYEDGKKDGADVYLTIDSEMQTRAYTLLAANIADGQSGAVVVVDYKTGDVAALASYPSYDNNLFSFPIDPDVWEYFISENSENPLQFRATQSTYTPGSTFKPFASVPAIESGILTEYSTPDINIVRTDNVDTWTPTAEGWHYGAITRSEAPVGEGGWIFVNAMKSSDNIFFAYYTLRYVQEYGMDSYFDYLSGIGIGEAPAFELPVKASNLMNEDAEQNLDLPTRTGYGMAQLLVSPLQMASMYTAFENDGDIVNPTIVKKISRISDEGEQIEYENQTSYFKQDIMKTSTIDTMKTALRRVFKDGTAYQAGLSSIETVYGKTGTAMLGAENEREVNWIVGINSDPEDGKVYLVVVDSKKNEGKYAKLSILNGLMREDNYNNALNGLNLAEGGGASSGQQNENTGDGNSPPNDPEEGTEPPEPPSEDLPQSSINNEAPENGEDPEE